MLTECGFHLRGSHGFNLTSVWVESEGADRVAHLVKWVLTEEGVPLAKTAKESQVILYLRQEIVDKRVLSVSAHSGNVAELELNLRISMEIRKPNEEIVSEKQTISLVRDYSFDETAVLAMGTEEEVIREELLHDAVAQVIRRLESVQLAPATP